MPPVVCLHDEECEPESRMKHCIRLRAWNLHLRKRAMGMWPAGAREVAAKQLLLHAEPQQE